MEEPVVHVITTLIPLCLALGIVYATWGDNLYVYIFALYEISTFTILIIVEIALTTGLKLIATLLAHVPAGLVMFFVPIIAYIAKIEDKSILLFSIGSAFIGSIGLLFAFAALQVPILESNEILTILPLAYMTSAIFLALGLLLPEQWNFKLFPSNFQE
jgi:hypothetical protein